MTQRCIGVLLAGGLARRMGGGDKPLRVLAGAPLLAWTAAALRPQCSQLILNANGDPARFEPFGLPVAADDPPDFRGPLAGVLAGLDWIAANSPGVAFALTAPADTPFLPRDLAARLFVAKGAAQAGIACARSGDYLHSAVALWPVALRGELRRALLEEGLSKVGAFVGRHRMASADWPLAPFDPFFNVNSPQDLLEAERIASAFGLRAGMTI